MLNNIVNKKNILFQAAIQFKLFELYSTTLETSVTTGKANL